MTLDRWLILAVALFGVINTVLLRAVVFGKWAQRVEHPEALNKLQWSIERLSEQVGELRSLFDGRYTKLETRQLADHALLREIEREFHTWQAGINVKLEERRTEYESTREDLRKDVEALKVRCFGSHGVGE